MKPSERKKKLVEELASLHQALNVDQLYCWPKHKTTKDWLAETASVLKNLDEGDYQEFIKLGKPIVSIEARETRKKAANEIDNFVRRKVAEYKRCDFSSLDEDTKDSRRGTIGVWNKGKGTILDSNKFSGLGVGVLDEGKETKMLSNDFQGNQPISPKSNFGNITISGGTVIFGDGNKITQVAVKELVNALSEEIEEKVPEGQQKQNILHSLKEITTNETFASVAGTVIGEILRRVTRP